MILEKATIQLIYGGNGDSFQVLFNPNEYRLSANNQFSEVAIPGLPSPPIQYIRGSARTLSMQLFFDTYEDGSDVRDYTSDVIGLMDIDPDLHAPPVCLFTWGDLNFLGILERAEQRFTLFFPNGIPARATIDVTFKEFADPGLQAGRNRSANFDKRYVVRRGDTLCGIAAAQYGDPKNWRPVAEANGIDNPLALAPGTVLKIPAIE
ncbi:MAG TPA: LysM peptidoglycan-binding domain-containing protein [Geobacteraceae bacterium]|nr:LysM peptidoglycan-binding domain-containing protein [Geobacteraceae bacterium]